jgi:hypothetical protein
LPINLLDPEIPFGVRHTATDRIVDPFGHRRQREASVEAEAVAAELAPDVFVKVEGMEGAVEAGLEVAQQGVDLAELRQLAWVLPTGDDVLVAASRRGHGMEVGQAIREHPPYGSHMVLGPGADCLLAEATHS